ncbi:hypothetical protein INR49_003261 [Caranx melampygus]|nr:hypothetical protein INR49_003261 [Caranx melampygus]
MASSSGGGRGGGGGGANICHRCPRDGAPTLRPQAPRVQRPLDVKQQLWSEFPEFPPSLKAAPPLFH